MNLVCGPVLHESLRNSVERVPARCLGGHRFKSCRGLRFLSLSHARDMLIIMPFTENFMFISILYMFILISIVFGKSSADTVAPPLTYSYSQNPFDNSTEVLKGYPE